MYVIPEGRSPNFVIPNGAKPKLCHPERPKAGGILQLPWPMKYEKARSLPSVRDDTVPCHPERPKAGGISGLFTL